MGRSSGEIELNASGLRVEAKLNCLITGNVGNSCIWLLRKAMLFCHFDFKYQLVVSLKCPIRKKSKINGYVLLKIVNKKLIMIVAC